MLSQKRRPMNRINHLKPTFLRREIADEDEVITEWDKLREVPFLGDIQEKKEEEPTPRQKIIDALKEFRETHKDRPLSSQSLFFYLLDTLQPLLDKDEDSENLYRNYDFWLDALGEIKPLLYGYWAECDPRIISFLFSLFVSRFIVIVSLWKDVDFLNYYIRELVSLLIIFFDISTLESSVIANAFDHLKLSDTGSSSSLLLE